MQRGSGRDDEADYKMEGGWQVRRVKQKLDHDTKSF